MTTVLACLLILVSALNIWLRHSENAAKEAFYKRREKLLRVVEKHINTGSVVEMPVYGSSEIVDCETGKEELKFTEITCKGYWRDIFITLDGEKVTVFKWQEPERRRDRE